MTESVSFTHYTAPDYQHPKDAICGDQFLRKNPIFNTIFERNAFQDLRHLHTNPWQIISSILPVTAEEIIYEKIVGLAPEIFEEAFNEMQTTFASIEQCLTEFYQTRQVIPRTESSEPELFKKQQQQALFKENISKFLKQIQQTHSKWGILFEKEITKYKKGEITEDELLSFIQQGEGTFKQEYGDSAQYTKAKTKLDSHPDVAKNMYTKILSRFFNAESNIKTKKLIKETLGKIERKENPLTIAEKKDIQQSLTPLLQTHIKLFPKTTQFTAILLAEITPELDPWNRSFLVQLAENLRTIISYNDPNIFKTMASELSQI